MTFDRQVEKIMKFAVMKALYLQNIYVTPEHVLYAMADEKEFAIAFRSMGGSVQELKEDLDDFFEDMLPKKADAPTPNKNTKNGKVGKNSYAEETSEGSSAGEIPEQSDVDVSDALASVIELASMTAEGSGRAHIAIHHILWGLYEQTESFAVYFLEKQIGDKEELVIRLQQELDNASFDGADGSDEDAPLWSEFATLLNAKVKDHNPLIGREKELERCIQILCRKEKNNPLFLGEPGVGKTSMAYGLAEKIVNDEVPEILKGAQVFSMDLSAIIAGTQYRGEMEKRLKAIMESIAEEEKPIVFLDEIHNLVGAGGLSGNTMDASSLLKPYFEDGAIRFVGATTYEDYKKHFTKNKTLVRRFQNIDIPEPTVEETILILEGLKSGYEKFHGVKYGKDVSKHTVELSKRFVNERYLPDKAIDLMDEAGAYRKLHPIENKKTQTVDCKVIEEVLAATCKIPIETTKTDEVAKLKNLYSAITSKIFGQDEAVRHMVDAICMSRAGLLDENKPIAGLLFVGPTGVGKTEVAKVLSAEMDMPLVRFDMSEYAEKHTVAKLIGSPAGYVGYEEGGLLTDTIRKTPHCVLLLDEIEKAHPDIYNVLLQVLDYASLTDNKGQKADFRNVIIIMTSNAGARQIGKQQIGFGAPQYNEGEMMEEVKRVFSPEFRNRLSAIVTFHGMDRKMAEQIADKKLGELADKLKKRGVILEVDTEARDYLLDQGITREYGAREMERVLGTKINPLLVQELLFGKLKKGGKVKVSLKNGTPVVTCTTVRK